MLDHRRSCTCAVCAGRIGAIDALQVEQVDRDALADMYARWRPEEAREVHALRAGNSGAPGSPRWVALQAVAATRIRVAKGRTS